MNHIINRPAFGKTLAIGLLAGTFILFERLAPGIALLAIAYLIFRRGKDRTSVVPVEAVPEKKLAEVIPLNAAFAPAWKDVDDFLQGTLDVIKTRFKFQTANIFLRGEDKTTLIQRAFISSTKSVARLAVIKVGHGLVGWVAAHKRPLSVGNLKHEGRSMGYYKTGGETVSSFMAVPIIAGSEVVGVLSIDHQEPDAFKGSETQEALTAIAGLLARVLGAEEQSESRVREADRIKETNRILRASYRADDVDSAASAALHELISVAEFTSAAVYLLDENNKPSRRASVGFNGIFGNEVKEPIMQRAVAQALSHGNPFRVEGVALAAQYRTLQKPAGILPELLIALPIFSKGEALGALVVELANKKAYDKRIEGILSDVVADLGGALLRVYKASTAEGALKTEAEMTQFSSNLLAVDQLEELWGRIFSFLMAHTNATAAAAYRKTEKGFAIESVAGCSPTHDFVSHEEGLLAWTSLAGRPIIASPQDEKRIPLDAGESFLLFPIANRAVVILVSDDKDAFTDDHVAAVKEFSEAVQPIISIIDKLECLRQDVDMDRATGVLNEEGLQKRLGVMAVSSPANVGVLRINNYDEIVKEYGRKEARLHLRKIAKALEGVGVTARTEGGTFVVAVKEELDERKLREIVGHRTLAQFHDLPIEFSVASASTREGLRWEELVDAAETRSRDDRKHTVEHVA